MAHRIALVVALTFCAYLVGYVALQTQPAASAPPTWVKLNDVKHAEHQPRVKAKPSTLIGRVRGSLAVRSRPNGPVLARLSVRTEFGSPQTVAVTRAARSGFDVITAALPNGHVGWVSRSSLRLRRTHVMVDVDLSRQLLRVRNGNRVVRWIRVGIGAPGTPTPTGRFAVTDKLNGAAYSPVYGCCILALSGHQTNLPRGWTGGDRLAIHGGPLGAVSTGCLHASTAALRYLMRSVPLGAQIVIHP